MSAFDIPQGTMLPVRAVHVRLVEGPHPFEAAHESAIRANWEKERAAKPALFDGPIVLLSDLAYRYESLFGRCHLVRYSTFLFWRSLRPVTNAGHAFAHAALVASDGALVAIRMGAQTVNAGSVYFAAGSFEPEDFRDGQVDLAHNMRREVLEETGVDLGPLRRDRDYVAHSSDWGTAIFHRHYLDETADEAASRIAAHVAGEAEPEIAGPVVIRDGEAWPEGLTPHMEAFARWHFGGGE